MSYITSAHQFASRLASIRHLNRCLLFSLTIPLLFACTQEETISPAYANLARAKSYLDQGQLSSARIELLNALQADADNPQTHFILSDLFTSLGANKEALVQYEKGLSLSGSPTVELSLGLLRLKALSDLPSEQILSEINKLAPETDTQSIEKSLISAAVLIKQAESQPDAQKLYTKVLTAQPDNTEALLGLARVSILNDSFDSARSHLEKLLAIDPTHIDALLLGGKLALTQDQNADAEQLFTKALASQKQLDTMTPTKYLTLSGLTEALNRQQKYKQALTYSSIISKSRPGKLKSNYQGALTALSEKNYGKARSNLEEALKLSPSHAPSNYMMGIMELKRGELDAAETHLSKALQGEYIPEKTRIALIITRLRLNQLEEAKKLIRSALAESPENPTYHALNGNLLLQENKYKMAEQAFTSSLNHQSGFLPAVSGLARVYEMEGETKKAREQMKKIIKLAPGNIRVLTNHLKFSSRTNDINSGVNDLKKLEKLNPTLIAPPMALAAYFFQQKDLLKTQKYIDIAEVINADNPMLKGLSSNLHFLKAVNAAQTGNNKTALDQLNHAIVIQPNNIKPYILKAGLLAKDGQTEKAIAVAKTLQKNPKTKLIGIELEGNIWAQLAHFSKAELAYKKAWKIKKNKKLAVKIYRIMKENNSNNINKAMRHIVDWADIEPKNISALTTLAIIHQENKHQSEAIKVYEKALRLQNDNALILNNLAFLYFETDDSRALKLASQAHTLAPKNAAIADTYGWILVENKQISEGLIILQQAAELAPMNKEILQHYSSALTKAGKLDEAAAIIDRITKL